MMLPCVLDWAQLGKESKEKNQPSLLSSDLERGPFQQLGNTILVMFVPRLIQNKPSSPVLYHFDFMN